MRPRCLPHPKCSRRPGPAASWTWAALITTASACGGPATPPTTSLAASSAVADAEQTPAPEPVCRFDLSAQRDAQPQTAGVLGEDGIGTVLVAWTGEGSGDTLWASFDARDREGREAGTLEYICDPDGLRLRRIQSSAGTLSFAPALVVLPSGAGAGETSGVVGARTNDLDGALPFTHSWSATAAQAPEAFADLDASWVHVESELTIDVAGTARSWQTRTLWAVTASGHFFAAARDQTERGVEGSRARQERTESVVIATDSPRW